VLVVGLFVATSSFPPLQPLDGDGSPEEPPSNNGGQQEPGNGPDTVPLDLSQHSQDSILISDSIDSAVSRSSQLGGIRFGVPSGGGGGNGPDDNGNGEPMPIFDALVRVVPDPVPSIGLDVEAFGITNASSTAHATFSLFGPDCPLESGVACAVESDFSKLSPPGLGSISHTELCKTLCEEYSVLFSGEHLDVAGEHQIHVTFFDSTDNVIVIKDMNFRVHSFFVIPESQLGAIALILSSLGTLVAMYFVKVRRK
jgi:hypothetical protein